VESEATEVIYVVDMSSLVNVQRTYPLSVFPGLWQRMAELARDGRLISTREVYRELEQGGDDEIFQWATGNRFMFRDPNPQQIEIAREIVNHPKFPGLFDIDSEKPDADPFVIALAVDQQRQSALFPKSYVVVADEARVTPGKKPRIPDVCRDERYQAQCINILEMFKREGWEFVRKSLGGPA
jgi:hypothetical protein